MNPIPTHNKKSEIFSCNGSEMHYHCIMKMKPDAAPRKTTPMQIRMELPFKEEIHAAAAQLQISSCDLVRLSVATQLRKLRTGQLEISDLVGS